MGQRVFLSCTGLSLTRFFVPLLLPVLSLPYASSFTGLALASRLDSPCPWFCPLSSVAWSFSGLLYELPVEPSWPSPSPCLSNQSSQFAGPSSSLCFPLLAKLL